MPLEQKETIPAGSSVPQVPAPAPVSPRPTSPVLSNTSVDSNPVPGTPAARVVANTISALPLRSPRVVDLARFNQLYGDKLSSDFNIKPIDDMKRLFVKQVITEDGTNLDVETIKVPGFIGISDAEQVTDPQGKQVSGHADIVEFLKRDGLLICTYQWNKDRYGVPFDLRQPMHKELFLEGFIKNEGHHSGAIVPAVRLDQNKEIPSYATFNEPDDYHRGMYGKDGYVAVAQRLVFPEFVTAQQARGYTDTIINWMALLNPFVQFPSNYNGGDPVRIADRPTLKELLKNALLASLGDNSAIAFLKKPENMTYCAEFMFICINTPIYPFNLQGLTKVLDGDSAKAKQVLELRDLQNRREANALSRQNRNPQFKLFNIPMPVVPEDLPPLDQLLAKQGQSIDPQSIPCPPFRISQVIRRAFRTLLPRQQFGDARVAKAQTQLFKQMEPALLQQLGLNNASSSDPKVQAVQQFVSMVCQQLERSFSTYEEFDQTMDQLMAKADEMLVGEGDRTRFVPPRVFIDWGQNDGDNNIPIGWGFKLETVGALIARSVIRSEA
jgi:hypothetical protein